MAVEAKIILSADDKTKAAFSSAQSNMKALGLDTESLLKKLAIGLSAGAFIGFIRSTIDANDALKDLNKSTDISVERLAGLKLAAKQSGSDLAETAKIINKLQLEIGKDPAKFAKIGITDKDGLEAFKQLSDIFRSIEDPQLRAAVAAEALGKSWASAAPLLAEGSTEIQRMIDKGTLLAGVSQADAEAADAFNDRLVEFQTAMGGAATQVASSMLPMLTELAIGLTDTAVQAREAGAGFNPLTEALRATLVFGGNVAYVLKTVGKEIGGIGAQLGALGRGDFRQVMLIRESMMADAEKSRADFDKWEARMMSAGVGPTSAGGTREEGLQKFYQTNQMTAARMAALKTFSAAAGNAGKPAKTDAQREAERRAEEARQFNIGQAIAAGEAVNKGNEEFQREKAKAIEDEIKFRRDLIADEGEAILASNKAFQDYKKELLDAGPAAQLEKQRKEMQLLADLLTSGEISTDQYLDAVTGRLGLVNDKLEDGKDIGKELGMTFASAFEDAVIGGKKFSEVLQGLGQDIARIVLRKQFTEPFAGAITSGLKGGDLFGSLGGFFSNLFSFDGGGYTGSGSRSGGLDGKGGFLSMLHPQETVTDHTKPGGARGVTLVNSPVFNIDSRTDQGAVLQIMQQGFEANNKQMIGLLQKQGVLAS